MPKPRAEATSTRADPQGSALFALPQYPNIRSTGRSWLARNERVSRSWGDFILTGFVKSLFPNRRSSSPNLFGVMGHGCRNLRTAVRRQIRAVSQGETCVLKEIIFPWATLAPKATHCDGAATPLPHYSYGESGNCRLALTRMAKQLCPPPGRCLSRHVRG